MKNYKTGQEAEGEAPFSSSRMLLANAQEAEELIRSLVAQVTSSFLGFHRPSFMLVQLIEIPDDGFSEVEITSFFDAAEQAGAREAIVIATAKELSENQIERLFKGDREAVSLTGKESIH